MSVLPPEYYSRTVSPYFAESPWPQPFDVWGVAGEYPAGRGQARTGWCCAGCGRGFSPAMRECPYCPQTPPHGSHSPAGVSTCMGPGDPITDDEAEG